MEPPETLTQSPPEAVLAMMVLINTGLLELLYSPPPILAELAEKVTLVRAGLLVMLFSPPPATPAELAEKVTLASVGLPLSLCIPPP